MIARRARAALFSAVLGAWAVGARPAAAELELGAGPQLLLTGDGGRALRWGAAAHIAIAPRLELGACACAVGGRDGGLAMLRLGWVPAASRPRLLLRLAADAGVAWALPAPVVGVGANATLRALGPLALSLEAGVHVVLDGAARTHAITSVAVRVGARL